VTRDEQKDLHRLLRRFDLQRYDRIVLDLLFRHVSRWPNLLSGIDGLVLYEEDACQNFLAHSAWRGKFSRFYRKLPNARIVCTGHRVAERLRTEGIDAHFVPKGFDSAALSCLSRPRDIAYGFIGRLGSSVYRQRREILERAEADLGLKALRTEPGSDYCETLNRIRTFVSADIGLGEYMAKNFEAMACGCLLLAHRQGAGEEEALGLRDGENILLYDDYEELLEKAAWIERNTQAAEEIALRGMACVNEHFDYGILSDRLFAAIRPDMPAVPSRSPLKRLLSRWS
jgi:glycosyltransferase involved in cell wall biosynthesis